MNAPTKITRRPWAFFPFGATMSSVAVSALVLTGCSSRIAPVSPNAEPVDFSASMPVAAFESAAPSDSRPATAAMRAMPDEVAAGGTIELFVHVVIAAGHHLYARVPENSPFSATALRLDLPPGVEALGDWSATTPSEGRAGEFLYTEAVVFRRRLRVDASRPAGPLIIAGELHYQACTEDVCWPPDVLPLSTALRVVHTQKQTP